MNNFSNVITSMSIIYLSVMSYKIWHYHRETMKNDINNFSYINLHKYDTFAIQKIEWKWILLLLTLPFIMINERLLRLSLGECCWPFPAPHTWNAMVLVALPATSYITAQVISASRCFLSLPTPVHFFPIPSPAFFSRAPLGAQIRPSRAPELRRWWGHTSFITHLTGFQIKHHSSVEDRSYFYAEMKTAPF